MSRDLTLLLPFRIFKYPDTAPWTLVNGRRRKLHTRKQVGVRGLVINVLVVLTLLFGITSHGLHASPKLREVQLISLAIALL